MTTAPVTLRTFFVKQIQYLRRAGLSVHTISAPVERGDESDRRLPMHMIPMTRGISPAIDLISLFRLWRIFGRIRPAIVHTHTPKAGLLGMIAACLARVSVRIYTINGLVWITHTGWKRCLLESTERIACALATDVLCVRIGRAHV